MICFQQKKVRDFEQSIRFYYILSLPRVLNLKKIIIIIIEIKNAVVGDRPRDRQEYLPQYYNDLGCQKTIYTNFVFINLSNLGLHGKYLFIHSISQE